METIYQMWGLPPREGDWESLLQKLALLEERVPARAVVCGLGAPGDVYARIFDLAKKAGSRVFCWLPVFSEWDALAEYDPLVSFDSSEPLTALKPGDFHFRCPQSPRNREIFYTESLRHLKKAPFDGVFLDRIRYPSFQYGLPAALTCFCPACCRRYAALGLDAQSLRESCRHVAGRIRQGDTNPLGLAAYEGLKWRFADTDFQSFMEARCHIICEALEDLIGRYRTHGYQVGLDLFSPALGYFAGQDGMALSPLADFVKPMIYLHTLAPAGLPYEIDALVGALSGQGGAFRALCGAQTPEGFARQEIARMQSHLKGHDIFCGFEMNRVPPIAPVGPDEIRASLAVLNAAGARGVMPSWDLMSAPMDNVTALADALEGFCRP